LIPAASIGLLSEKWRHPDAIVVDFDRDEYGAVLPLGRCRRSGAATDPRAVSKLVESGFSF
jgi:hypothetical protein